MSVSRRRVRAWISRGARSATLVELNEKSLETIRKNVAAIGVQDRVTLKKGDAMRFVSGLGPLSFDLALADPPYSVPFAARLIEAFRAVPFAALLAVEHAAREAPAGDETRRYGDIALTFCYAP